MVRKEENMDPQKDSIEGQAVDPPPADQPQSPAAEIPKGKTTPPLNKAWKQVENIGQTLGEALQGRGNVVMVRVNDETLEHLDMLVEAELCKSRSEAAALLINEGIKTNQTLFSRIREITDQIAGLRSQLRVAVRSQDEENPENNDDQGE
jgi:hypothetical protein